MQIDYNRRSWLNKDIESYHHRLKESHICILSTEKIIITLQQTYDVHCQKIDAVESQVGYSVRLSSNPLGSLQKDVMYGKIHELTVYRLIIKEYVALEL